NLDISEIKSAITDSTAFSADNSLDLVGFDACLMQTYEVGLELASIANVMVASQETEPGDGWDYQGFLNSLAANPYASSETLGGYIVDSYDSSYDSVSETLSSVDLSKYQAIDDAMTTFNTTALTASGSDWLIIDDAVGALLPGIMAGLVRNMIWVSSLATLQPTVAVAHCRRLQRRFRTRLMWRCWIIPVVRVYLASRRVCCRVIPVYGPARD
ncbi:clostripain-related cysteine peptidase, partial [Litorivicinus sp.]|nr:clostripain-related cysteine peptidase [Litorivicinus sp.]